MPTTEKVCSCSNEFQDNIYGKNVRLMNLAKGSGDNGNSGHKEARCTSCGKAMPAGEFAPKAKK